MRRSRRGRCAGFAAGSRHRLAAALLVLAVGGAMSGCGYLAGGLGDAREIQRIIDDSPIVSRGEAVYGGGMITGRGSGQFAADLVPEAGSAEAGELMVELLEIARRDSFQLEQGLLHAPGGTVMVADVPDEAPDWTRVLGVIADGTEAEEIAPSGQRPIVVLRREFLSANLHTEEILAAAEPAPGPGGAYADRISLQFRGPDDPELRGHQPVGGRQSLAPDEAYARLEEIAAVPRVAAAIDELQMTLDFSEIGEHVNDARTLTLHLAPGAGEGERALFDAALAGAAIEPERVARAQMRFSRGGWGGGSAIDVTLLLTAEPYADSQERRAEEAEEAAYGADLAERIAGPVRSVGAPVLLVISPSSGPGGHLREQIG